jgi:gluconolactonase
MNRIFFISLAVLTALFAGCETPAAGKLSLLAPDARIQKVATGFGFTEGPAADVRGNIYFTDIPNNRIHIIFLDGALAAFMENTGGANGLYFDEDANLLACRGGDRQLVSIDPDGKVTVLADKFNDNPLNSPNDLWIDPKGGVYFTDPRYGSKDDMFQNGEHVYYLTPDRKKLIRVIDDMVRPNGIIGTPDGKILYVADLGGSKTFRYSIKPDGTLTEKELFINTGSDGMTIDIKGNIYITTNAVEVYDLKGKLLGKIDLPEWPSNVTFGGPDKDTLFITARTSVYSIKTNTKGL